MNWTEGDWSMQKLPTISATAVSRRQSAPATVTSFNESNLPAAFDKLVDSDIPLRVWSSWIPAEGRRQIIRPLTSEERSALAVRAAALGPALAPFRRPEDDDRVVVAVGEMFGSFRSMRDKGANMAATVDAVMRALAPFPAWAIERACSSIRIDGYEIRDGGSVRIEKHWPPNDSEIVAEVRKVVKLRADALASARALLGAEVEHK